MELLENAYIYCFKQEGNIIYIGKTHQEIDQRLYQHLHNCHNDKLKEYLESSNPPTFEVIYESHNKITEETLCSIEQSYIETLKPKCNILGVTKPYDYFTKKKNIVQPKYQKGITEEEINSIMSSNPQICEVQIITITQLIALVNPGKEKNQSEQRKARHGLEKGYGKLNDFNERVYFNPNTGNFQQKVWCVQKEDNSLRPFTIEEKYCNKLIPKGEKAVQARLLFNYYTDEEYMEHLKKLTTMDWEDNVDKEIFLILRSLYINDPDHLKKYYPLKVVKQGNGVLMVDTLYEELFINNQ